MRQLYFRNKPTVLKSTDTLLFNSPVPGAITSIREGITLTIRETNAVVPKEFFQFLESTLSADDIRCIIRLAAIFVSAAVVCEARAGEPAVRAVTFHEVPGAAIVDFGPFGLYHSDRETRLMAGDVVAVHDSNRLMFARGMDLLFFRPLDASNDPVLEFKMHQPFDVYAGIIMGFIELATGLESREIYNTGTSVRYAFQPAG